MRTRFHFLFTAAVLIGSGFGVARAQIILNESFESYTNTAQLGNTWTLGDGTLNTGFGNPGQSLLHPGNGAGNTNSFSFSALNPTAGQVIRFSADIYDDATSANKRVSAGLRGGAASNIIEIGMYNSPAHYAYRTVLFDSGATNWQAFSGLVDDSGVPIANVPLLGWHRYSAEITPAGVTFSLDLNSDGFINSTAFIPAVATAAGFDIVRLGGPSNLSSPGGGASFDNVSVTVVPEPSAFLMFAPAVGLLMMRRRRQ